MACRLCLQKKDIINSHILPEYLFVPMYSKDKGKPKRFYAITDDPNQKRMIHQKGYREKLLCHDCDNKLIGIHEKYAKDVIFDIQTRVKDRKILRRLTLNDVQYKSFKLFQLSILWRASITSLSEFSNISLTNYDNELLRKKLLAQNPGKPKEFGCQLLFPACKNKIIRRMITPQFIMPPMRADLINGYDNYHMFFGKLLWIFFITDADANIFKELFISENNSLPVFKVKKPLEERMYEYFRELGVANLKRENK